MHQKSPPDSQAQQVRLSNIRTLLAFCRTAVAFWGLGLAMFHLINRHPFKALGVVSVGIGFMVLAWGGVEYLLIDRLARSLEKAPPDGSDTG